MNDMKRFRLPMASVLLVVWVATVGATEGLAPMPVAVAESEAFEAVGRLSDEGLVWFIDRADSNAPVLDARLEVEANGQTQVARFRPEQGDYLIADAGWLKALRQPGEHALALTLLAGDDSDLHVRTGRRYCRQQFRGVGRDRTVDPQSWSEGGQDHVELGPMNEQRRPEDAGGEMWQHELLRGLFGL